MRIRLAEVTYHPETVPAYNLVRVWVCGMGGCTHRHPTTFHNIRALWLRWRNQRHYERTITSFPHRSSGEQYDLIRLHGLERHRWDMLCRALTGEWWPRDRPR